MAKTTLSVIECDSIEQWEDKAREFYSLFRAANLPGVIYLKVNLHVKGYAYLHTLEYGVAQDKGGVYCTCWSNETREARSIGEINLQRW